jgi:hypothetical protein
MSKPSVFSPEDHQRILELIDQDSTIVAIAEAIGRPEKTVRNYLKAQRIQTARAKMREKRREKTTEEVETETQKALTQSLNKPQEPRTIQEPTSSDYKMRLITLEEKKPYDCSWIIGDPKRDYRYCGNSTLGTKGVYCKYHTDLSYNKQPPIVRRPLAPLIQK